MPIQIEIEGKGQVAEFPDGTADDVIDAAIQRDFFGKTEETMAGLPSSPRQEGKGRDTLPLPPLSTGEPPAETALRTARGRSITLPPTEIPSVSDELQALQRPPLRVMRPEEFGQSTLVTPREMQPRGPLTRARDAMAPPVISTETVPVPERPGPAALFGTRNRRLAVADIMPEFMRARPEETPEGNKIRAANILALQNIMTDQGNIEQGKALAAKDQAIQAEVSAIDELETKVTAQKKALEGKAANLLKMKGALDIEAAKVDKTSQESIDNFNSLVREYNQKVAELKSDPYNNLVTTYNNRLSGLKKTIEGFKDEARQYVPKGVPSLSAIEQNYDALTKELGIRNLPTSGELIEGLMGAAIAAGLVTHPLGTVAGVGAFMAAKEAESLTTQALSKERPKLGQGRELKEFLGPLREPYATVADIAEFFVPGVGVGKGLRAIKNSTWFRRLQVPEQGVVIKSLDAAIKDGMTNAEIRAAFRDPANREALLKKYTGVQERPPKEMKVPPAPPPEKPVAKTAPETVMEEKVPEIVPEEKPPEIKVEAAPEMPAPAPGVGEAKKVSLETGEAKAEGEIARPGASDRVEKEEKPAEEAKKMEIKPKSLEVMRTLAEKPGAGDLRIKANQTFAEENEEILNDLWDKGYVDLDAQDIKLNDAGRQYLDELQAKEEEAKHAVTTGEKQTGDLGEYPGAGPVIQGKGEDRVIAPRERGEGAEAGGGDRAGQGPEKAEEAAGAEITPAPDLTQNTGKGAHRAKSKKAAEIEKAANEAATSPQNDLPEPTEGQIKEGNYQKGHINLHGFDISIENPRGSERSGVDQSGKEWSVTMEHHYGYIKGTKGKDKDHIDVFIGPNPTSTKAYVVDQVNPETGKFDEHKIVLGFDSEDAAQEGYLANYEKGWKGLGKISETDVDQLKTWLKEGDTTKPYAKKIVRVDAEKARNNIKRLIRKIKGNVGDKRKLTATNMDYDSLKGHLSDLRQQGDLDQKTIDLVKNSGLYDEAAIKEVLPEAVAAEKQPWEMTQAEFRQQPGILSDAQAYGMHKTEVVKALSEGKEVPPEVLKDYPELAKKPESAKIPSVEEKPGTANIPPETTPKAVGGTKIVDDAGNPLTVYHGTRWEFDIFNTEKGAFFSDSKAGAETYARELRRSQQVSGKKLSGKPRLIPAQLDIRHPLDLSRFQSEESIFGPHNSYRGNIDKTATILKDFLGNPTDEQLRQAINDPFIKSRVGTKEALMNLYDNNPWEFVFRETFYGTRLPSFGKGTAQNLISAFGYEVKNGTELHFENLDPQVKRLLENLGYDGIIFNDTAVGNLGDQANIKSYVAFHPDQIKILPDPSRPPEGGGQEAPAPTKETKPAIPETEEPSGELSPINLDENTGKGEKGARRKLTEQEKAERDAKKQAAAEEKARKAEMGKFKNVGFVYDPEHLNNKIRDKPPKSAAKIIVDEMVNAKVWNVQQPEGTTPGTVRVLDQTKKYFKTFKDFLEEKEWSLRAPRTRRGYSSSFDQRLDAWIERGGTIEELKAYAEEYGKALQPVIDAFQGQTSITNAIGRLQDAILPGIRKEDGSFPDYLDLKQSEKPALLQKRDLVSLSGSVYRFITKDWAKLLDDENDILLSEISAHKRPRNKSVIRAGLPEYREGVELKKTEDFQEPFGFKGVGFGEESWINQEERNRVIPAAFDAFKDLAATIGAPDKGMGIGNQLAVQFANLGHKAKGAAAAYFPTVQTINFTRDSGDGTMSHEWGHAFHYLADNVKAEVEKVIESFYHIYDFDAGTRLADDLLAKDSPFLKRLISSKKQLRLDAVKEKISEDYESTVKKETDYYATAKQMDKDYTARKTEMWARAFEAYIYDHLAGRNNYLVSDWVASGRVGGKSQVGTLLVYPSGAEREAFNTTIQRFLDGVQWNENGVPSLKADYLPIDKHNEQIMADRLAALLATVEDRYKAIWNSEPSKDGLYWYRYDLTAFGPMMQPDGYSAYDKIFKAEEQGGTGAVGYLTQLHPDAILDYKLTNIQYEGAKPTYITEEGGGIDGFRDSGEEALDEVPPGHDKGAKGGGDLRPGGEGGGEPGEGGRGALSGRRRPDRSGQGDRDTELHLPAPGNYRIIDDALTDPKPVAERFNSNLAAIRVLKQVESEQRSPTPQEKGILAGYSGWGDMAELFSWSPTEAWRDKKDLLDAELTGSEIEGAEESSPTAYYTPVPVARFMWKLAQRLGFEKGIVLDPANGANAVFMGTIPPDIAESVIFQGVEMDSLSARIAAKLYEQANIENKPFQEVKKPLNRFDFTITNVPFANVTPTDLKHNKGGHKLHNYFINKMLDLTAPGALSMAITTSRTLDNVGVHLTEYAAKADLVGAIRLPSGIYSATEVPTDILVFRKKIEGSKFQGIPVEDWTQTGKDEATGLAINNYFLKHPEMMAGKLEKITGRYGDESLRVAGAGDLVRNLENLSSAFPGKIVEREVVRQLLTVDDLIPAPGSVKEGGYYINDKGEASQKMDGQEVKLPVATAGEQKVANTIRGYVEIMDKVFTVLRAQKTNLEESVIKAEQAKLKKAYDDFVKKFGPINDPKNLKNYFDATDSAWVTALEEYDPDSGKVVKLADIFTKKIVGKEARPERAESDHDALAMSLDEFGYPNLDYMAKLRGSDSKAVLAGVLDKIVENPETGFLETMEEYLSGNVKHKLAIAREMAQSNSEYERNVKLLEAALPEDLPAHRITARIGASWIIPEHLADFVREKANLTANLTPIFSFNPVTNEWSMTFEGGYDYSRRGENKAKVRRDLIESRKSIESTRVWGTPRMDFFQLMQHAIEGKRPVVTYRDFEGKVYVDEVATQAAEAKLRDIQDEFGRWLFAESRRAEEAVKKFNDLINTSIAPKTDGSHLTFPGKSLTMLTAKEASEVGINKAMVLYPHQPNAVWKYLRFGNLYLAHEVGAGKTATMVLAAMEAKRLRGKKKVVYVTLNDSTMGQAIEAFKSLYPLSNVMTVRVSTQEQRKRLALQKIAINDFDVAIMRQQDLDRISLSPEAEYVFIKEEVDELRAVLEEAKANNSRILERDIQERIWALEEKLKGPGVHAEAKSKNLFFDDLGIDLIIVDEAHSYKNVPYTTRLTRITGLNPAGSPTAQSFFRKTQYLNAQFPKHDAIILASGTPLTNSIAEMYNIQRMLQPQEVKRQGVWSFDRWIANYGDIGSQLEWDGARGKYKSIVTNRKIVNAGRLLATAYQNIDAVRAEDTPIRRPEIKGGGPQGISIQPNQYVEDYKRIVLERVAAMEADPRHAEFEGVPDNMLRLISNMSKVAIDQRLDPRYANTPMQEDSKIYKASRKIYERWKEETQHKGVQLVYSDIGVPHRYEGRFKYKTDEELAKLDEDHLAAYEEEKFEYENQSKGFNTYDGLKEELIKLGIPRDQIAFIHDADSPNKTKKAANLRQLFKKVNSGAIRVLIGSTSKAGTGVNVQERVSDIHHIDIWWNYSAWEQRNGRAIRAGNIYTDLGGVNLWNYVTETTVDATRWDKVFAKGKVLNAVLGGDINLDVIEDISDATMSAKQMAALASGDPLMAKQAELFQQTQNLRFEQSNHLDTIRRSRLDLAALPDQIGTAEKRAKEYRDSHDLMAKVTAVRFANDERTLVFEKHGKEIAEALEKAVAADTSAWIADKRNHLLSFGSHTETEKEIKGKKAKEYEFNPLPMSASITGVKGDPFGRRLLVSGLSLSTDRHLADIKLEKGKKPKVEVKANVSRTVTEYVTFMERSEQEELAKVADFKARGPKLQQIVDTPWPKTAQLAAKEKQLVEIERQMAESGQQAGSSESGMPIERYKGSVPVLEDVAEKDRWSIVTQQGKGVLFPTDAYPDIAIAKPFDPEKFFQAKGKFSPRMIDKYAIPDSVEILGILRRGAVVLPKKGPAIEPIAFTRINDVDRFWFKSGDKFLTIDPQQWRMLERIIGKSGTWHYVDHHAGTVIVHTDTSGVNDAFIRTAVERTVPEGVREIAEAEEGALSILGNERGSLGDLSDSEIVAALEFVKDDVASAMTYVSEMGQRVYEGGKTSYSDWQTGMKERFGRLLERFKDYLKKIWQRISGRLRNQRGAVGPVTKASDLIPGDQVTAKGRKNPGTVINVSEKNVTVLFREREPGFKAIVNYAIKDGYIEKDALFREVEEPVKEPRTTGIKNRVTLEEREARGLSEVEQVTKRNFPYAFDKGKQMVDSGEIDPRMMAASLAENPRALNAEESVALIYDRMRLQNDHASVMSAIEKAIENNDPIAEAENRQRLVKIEADIEVNDEAARRTGYEQGLGLAARKMMIAEDYSLARTLQRVRVAGDGKEVPSELRTKLEEMTKKLQEAIRLSEQYEGRIAELEAARAIRQAVNQEARLKREKKRTYVKSELDVEFKSLASQLRKAMSPTQLNMMVDPVAAKIMIQMARNRIRSGITSVEGVVEDIYNEIADDIGEDLSMRDVRDAISGYGKIYELSKEEIDVQLRELKRKARLISAYEDAQSKMMPLRSGLQRDKMTDEVRELGRKVRQAMRESGIANVSARSPEEQWKSALDAIKARLRNQIADLTKQIQTGEKTPKRIGIKYDVEAEALRKQRDALKEALEKIEGKTEMSDEQRVKIALQAAERSLNEYKRRIQEKDLTPQKKPSKTPETPELQAIRAQRDALREVYRQMRKDAKPKKDPEELRLEAYKKRVNKRIEELEGMLASGDYSKKPRKPVGLDTEALRLKAHVEGIKKSVDEEIYKIQLANRTATQKVIGRIAEGINLTRAIKTSFDLSALLRQGAIVVFGHPVRGIKAMPAMFKALWSEERQMMVEEEIKSRPNYNLYTQGKLFLSEHKQRLSRMEEVYMSRLATKIPGVAASGRAYTTFLNRLRADSFDAMVSTLGRRGEKPTPEELKAIGNYVNVATGRGTLVGKEQALVGLNTVFFAPRYVLSRFQFLAGQPLYRGTGRTRKMVAKEYARFLIGLSVVYALAVAAGGDIEPDPRSADFGKIRFGKTRIDPLAGLSQTIVLLSRINPFSGKTKTANGKVVPTRGPDAIKQFLRTKLSPVVGAGVNLTDRPTKKKAVGTGINTVIGQNVVGEPVTPITMARDLVAPLSLNDIYEAMKEQGVPAGTAFGTLSIFGMGIQTYDTKKKPAASGY